MLNQDGAGDEINITSALSEHDNSFYVFNVDVTNKITYKNGHVKFWIKILKPDNEMVAKTNTVNHQIKDHIDIEDYIPEQELSLLDDFSIRMEQSLVKTEETMKIVDDLKQKVDNLDVGEVSKELVKEYIDEAIDEVIDSMSVAVPTRAFVNILGGNNNWMAEEVFDGSGNVVGKRYGQLVNVNNAVITPNSKVDLQITSEQMVVFHKKDLAFVAENDDGVVTIYCIGSIPQNNYVIQAIVTEVVVDV